MFTNFRDTFIKKPQFTSKIPDAVLKTVGKTLPDGFRYVEDHDGYCRLDCDGSLDISGFHVALPKEAESVFNSDVPYTFRNLLTYSYNTQTIIKLSPDQDGCYTVNGEKIKANDFIIAPLKGTEISNGCLYIKAPAFPAPFPIEIAGNGYALTLMLEQQTINSIDKMRFASVGQSALKISYILDFAKADGTMQFNISLCPYPSVSDVLAAKEIFNAFSQGNGTLGGVKIFPNKDVSYQSIPDETLQFWRHLYEIENILNVKFDASNELTIDDVKNVDKLYRCLVEGKPFISYQKEITLNGFVGENDAMQSKCKEYQGKEILFEYGEEVKIVILGLTLTLWSLVDIFDGKLENSMLHSDNGSGNFSVQMLPADGKRMYISRQIFLDHAGLEGVRNDTSHFERFRSATELEKY